MFAASGLLAFLLPLATAQVAVSSSDVCQGVLNVTFTSPNGNSSDVVSLGTSEASGMDHLYKITNYFVTLVIARPGVPEIFLQEEMVSDPTAFLLRDYTKVLKTYKGLLALVAVGVALAVLVPFVGVIVLCCRCCCHRCGGGVKQPERKGDTRRRGCRGLFLFLLVVALLFTIVCAFVTSAYVPSGIDNLTTRANQSASGMSSFLVKTKSELDTVLVTNYEEFQFKLLERLNGCTSSIGEEFSDLIKDNSKGFIKVTENLVAIDKEMSSVNTSLRKLKDIVDNISRSKAKDNLNEASKCTGGQGCDNVKAYANAEHLDFSKVQGELNNLFKKAESLKSDMEKLNPQELDSAVKKAVDPAARKQDLMTKVEDAVKAINDTVSGEGLKIKQSMETLKISSLLDSHQLQRLLRRMEAHLNDAKPYVSYYSYATLAVAGVLTTVLVTWSLGLTWGGCGSRDGSCNRHTGGSCLYLGAVIFVLAFFIPMLASTVLLSVGTVTQRSTCDLVLDLNQPEATSLIRFALKMAFKELPAKRTAVGKDKESAPPFLEVLNSIGAEGSLDIVKRFANCRGDSGGPAAKFSLYALLGEELLLNLTQVTTTENLSTRWLWSNSTEGRPDFSKKADEFLKEVDNAELGDAIPTKFQDKVKMLHDIDNISVYKSALDELHEKLENVSRMTDSLKTYKLDPLAADQSLKAVVKDLEDIRANDAASEIVKLKSSLDKLEGHRMIEDKQIKEYAQEQIDEAPKALDRIKAHLKRQAESYKEDLLKSINFFMDHVSKQLRESVGDCRPVYRVYQGAVNAVCGDILMPFNGFWFSVGAFLVIGVVALVFALCLSTLYAKVDPAVALMESLGRGDSDVVSGGTYVDSDTIPLARVNRKRRQESGGGGGGRGVYDNRDGYLHDASPEYREHHGGRQVAPPHRNLPGVASPGVAYVPAPAYQYSQDPGFAPYGKGYNPGYNPMAPAHRVPSGEWDGAGQFAKPPPPYYYPGA